MNVLSVSVLANGLSLLLSHDWYIRPHCTDNKKQSDTSWVTSKIQWTKLERRVYI